VTLSGKEGDDAHYYQEKQVRNAVREEVAQLHKGRKALPPPSTRPMRDAVIA
jgi:hypothetical protein